MGLPRPASGSGCRSVPGFCKRADLSVASGENHRRPGGGQRLGHRCASDRSILVRGGDWRWPRDECSARGPPLRQGQGGRRGFPPVAASYSANAIGRGLGCFLPSPVSFAPKIATNVAFAGPNQLFVPQCKLAVGLPTFLTLRTR
jgi:hypothetical protein